MNPTEANNASQLEINEREWSNPANWHWLGIYYGANDTRTFVPRRGFGATVNFARPESTWFLLGLMIIPMAIVLTAVLLTRGW